MKKLNPQQIINIEEGFISIDEKDVKKYLSRLKITEKPTIFFWGSDSFVVQVLEKLVDNFEVVGVITTNNSPIAQFALDKKIPIFTPDKLDNEFHSALLTLHSELFIVASYGKIIPQSFLDIPKYGALNIHPSLLPKFRGPSPVPATILSGDSETGVTIIKMDAEMDHGPIAGTIKVDLGGKEVLPELIEKLFSLGTELLLNLIPDFIEGKISLKSQDHTKATYSKIMKKEDGYFDLDKPPSKEVLDRIVRAYYPWPGVWTKWNNKIVKFIPINTVIPAKAGIQNAWIPGQDRDDKFLIQMEGKKPQTMQGFLNSFPKFPLKAAS